MGIRSGVGVVLLVVVLGAAGGEAVCLEPVHAEWLSFCGSLVTKPFYFPDGGPEAAYGHPMLYDLTAQSLYEVWQARLKQDVDAGKDTVLCQSNTKEQCWRPKPSPKPKKHRPPKHKGKPRPSLTPTPSVPPKTQPPPPSVHQGVYTDVYKCGRPNEEDKCPVKDDDDDDDDDDDEGEDGEDGDDNDDDDDNNTTTLLQGPAYTNPIQIMAVKALNRAGDWVRRNRMNLLWQRARKDPRYKVRIIGVTGEEDAEEGGGGDVMVTPGDDNLASPPSYTDESCPNTSELKEGKAAKDAVAMAAAVRKELQNKPWDEDTEDSLGCARVAEAAEKAAQSVKQAMDALEAILVFQQHGAKQTRMVKKGQRALQMAVKAAKKAAATAKELVACGGPASAECKKAEAAAQEALRVAHDAKKVMDKTRAGQPVPLPKLSEPESKPKPKPKPEPEPGPVSGPSDAEKPGPEPPKPPQPSPPHPEVELRKIRKKRKKLYGRLKEGIVTVMARAALAEPEGVYLQTSGEGEEEEGFLPGTEGRHARTGSVGGLAGKALAQVSYKAREVANELGRIPPGPERAGLLRQEQKAATDTVEAVERAAHASCCDPANPALANAMDSADRVLDEVTGGTVSQPVSISEARKTLDQLITTHPQPRPWWPGSGSSDAKKKKACNAKCAAAARVALAVAEETARATLRELEWFTEAPTCAGRCLDHLKDFVCAWYFRRCDDNTHQRPCDTTSDPLRVCRGTCQTMLQNCELGGGCHPTFYAADYPCTSH